MMRPAILLLLAGWAGAAWASPRATVDLLPNAEVRGDTVVLGQVARLRSGDLDLMRRLVHLPLGRAPRPGELAVLQRESLRVWIRRQTGLAAAEVDVRGSQESRVLGAARRVKGEDIAQVALDAARRWVGATDEVQVRVPVRDMEVPGTPVRLEPRPIDLVAPRRHMVLWVEVWAAGMRVRTVPVSLQLSAEVAPVRPLAGADASWLARAPDAEAPVASREALGVMRGDWATLRSISGPVVLEAAVEVLQDGRAGDKVRVRLRGAAALVMARVVGPGQVELAP